MRVIQVIDRVCYITRIADDPSVTFTQTPNPSERKYASLRALRGLDAAIIKWTGSGEGQSGPSWMMTEEWRDGTEMMT